MRINAMALTREALFIAGPPDAIDPEDPWEVIEGNRAGLLWALSLTNGEKKREVRLKASPVYDGMAAAGVKLYVSCRDGVLRCFGKQ